jgi:TRAP-type uncharacterized transport system substrate-binding protein
MNEPRKNESRLIEFWKIKRLSILDALFGVTLLTILLIIPLYIYYPTQPVLLSLASGTSGGTYSEFAVVLKKTIKKDGMAILDESSQGSIDNLERISKEKDGVDLALAQEGIASSKHHIPPEVRVDQFKVLAYLYDAYLFVAVSVDKKTDYLKSIEDINSVPSRGSKKIVIKPLTIYAGGNKSGTRVVFGLIAPSLRPSHENLDFNQAATGLLGGEIDVCFFLTADRASAIETLKRARDDSGKIRFLGFKQVNEITRPNKWLQPEIIAGVSTVKAREVLLGRSSLPELVAYNIADYIKNPGSQLRKEFTNLVSDPYIKDLNTLTYDYHPGAIRRYENKGSRVFGIGRDEFLSFLRATYPVLGLIIAHIAGFIFAFISRKKKQEGKPATDISKETIKALIDEYQSQVKKDTN